MARWFDEGALPSGWFDAGVIPDGWFDEGLDPASGNEYTLTAETGYFALSGQPATLGGVSQRVDVIGRAGRRVYVEIRNGQVYEATTEREARKVVRSIRRRVVRDIRRAERQGLPPPAIPQIQVDGVAPFLDSLKREVADVQIGWAAIHRRLWEDADEDDVEALLL